MYKLFAILFLLFTIFSNAQEKVMLVNSGELIQEGTVYHDEGKYDKALLKYKQVPENDTNYHLAVYEMGLSYLAKKDYPKAIELYQKGIKLETVYKASFIQQLGNAYSENKQLDKALEIYRFGLKEFPYYFRFYSEMGVACYKNNKPKEALIYLDSCLKINFFYGRAHFLMGQICEINNYFVPAILSYQMAAYLSYDNQVGLSSLMQIQKIANGEIEINKDSIIKLFADDENNFDDIDEIIRSKSELDENYKIKPSVNLPFNSLIKSLHLVNKRLNLNPEGKGWYYKNLIPIYLDWWKQGDFALILYRMSASVDNDQSKKMFAKNKSKIEKHYGDFYNEQIETRFTYKSRIAQYHGDYKHLFTYKIDNLFAIIPESEAYDFNKGLSSKNGYYVYFHNNGVKKSEGKYQNDVQNGLWYYYNKNGALEKKVDNISDNEFKRTTYYSNGKPEEFDHYKDGKFINDYIAYYPNGIIKSVLPMVNGSIEGKVKNYFDNGQLRREVYYEKGKQKDGEEINYHTNGTIKSKKKYKNEKLEGEFTEYYDNGKPYLKIKYKDGKANGNILKYHRNGVLMADYHYVDDEYDGSYKEYHDNGVLETESNYSKGENKGKSLYYDFDGKLYAEYVENKGKIKSAVFYNKQGKKIYEVDAEKNELELKKYNQVGILTEEGMVKKDFRVGEWKFYTQSGALKNVKEYDEKGNFNGKVETYLVGDILDEKYEMKDNKNHGYYIEYYMNGSKFKEGNYVQGEKEGVWHQYFKNNVLKQDEYYVNGDRIGTMKYYHPNGKIKIIEEYKEGLIYKFSYYDENGNFVAEDTIGCQYGNLIINGSNNKSYINFKYMNGKKEGKQYTYWSNGNYKNIEEYKNGKQINNEFNYYQNGNIKSQYKYKDDERDSIINFYYEDGTLQNSESFVFNESNGEEFFNHTNGKLSWKGINKDGDREGWFSYYSSDGVLQCKILYHLGIEMAYTYLSKSGKLMDSIPLKNASGNVNCFFQNGTPSLTATFVNGERNGNYVKYLSNGKKEFECTFKYGVYHGLYTDYFDNGNIKIQVTYDYSAKNGVEKEFDKNGKLIKETNWENNFRHGPQKFYNNGKLVKTINYIYDDTTDK